jgi:hypothetical protein
VAREVLEAGTPLEDIAVLVPAPGPLAALAAARLARLPAPGGRLPVHLADGLPLTAVASGARLAALLRALSAWLPAESVAGLLPALRAPVDGRTHLSHAEAAVLAWSLGTVGGSAADPDGALDWPRRASAREGELAAALEAVRRDDDAEAREAGRAERLLATLRAARPALEALAAVAERALAGAPLADLAGALLAFASTWLLQPGEGPPASALLAEALAPLRSDPVGAALRGGEALRVLEERLAGLRVAGARFGEPAVFVGTLDDAAGIPFTAVRVLGLCEGALPAPPAGDPVLPDAMRAELGLAVPTSADRAARSLHALHRAVGAATGRVALSAPRFDLERTEREPSSVLVEAAAALARPDPEAGTPAPALPDRAALRRTAFAPARAAAGAFRAEHPVSPPDWLDRAASDGTIHPAWMEDEALDLALAGDLARRDRLGPADAPLPGPLRVPGLTPEHPISASGLSQLLECPRRFLYARVLGWEEPAGAPSSHQLDPPAYGTLFHRVLETFYRAHGAAFTAREGALPRWQSLAGAIAERHLAELLAGYPLAGQATRAKERRRLLDGVRAWLEYDWGLRGPLALVDVERPFGHDRPLALALPGVTLFVRGFIDRVDVEDGHALVRDAKTGTPHLRRDREEGPTPARDAQIALYGMVAKQLAGAWGLPPEVQVAYAYAADHGVRERAFRADFAALERAATGWFAVAGRLLAERAFPPTPCPEDCRFCAFRRLCGADAPAAAAAGLARAGGALADFLALKLPPEEEDA